MGRDLAREGADQGLLTSANERGIWHRQKFFSIWLEADGEHGFALMLWCHAGYIPSSPSSYK
jgi:hypothetical protein